MKVYIVYAHPNPDSFNHAILDRFTQGLKEGGHSFEVSDLYADNFNASLDFKDLELIHTGRVSPEAKVYQDKIAAADGLAFICPIWWNSIPAILKGWFDRVFTRGFAYEFDKTGLVRLLKQSKALLINTAGVPAEAYQKSGIEDAMRKLLDSGVIRYCGIKNVEHTFFYNIINTDDATRKGYLEQAHKLGKEF